MYPDLAAKVSVTAPEWLNDAPSVFLSTRGAQLAFRYVEGVAVAALLNPNKGVIAIETWGKQDRDQDGIPDQLDLLLGAKKIALLQSPYVETYRVISYPEGDMPRDEGVCTDVIVRALRNAGFDLQQLIHEDWKRSPGSYPGIAKADKNIDHRRVRNLLVYLLRHFTRLPSDPSVRPDTFLPGDIVLFNTLGDQAPDHVGVVSDTTGPSGLPLVINSWTTGYVTTEMDLLPSVPVTHRFRIPGGLGAVASEQVGLKGLLAREQLSIPTEHRKILVAVAPQWMSSYGTLRGFELGSDGHWNETLPVMAIRLGANGLARGRGLWKNFPSQFSAIPDKREGDLRSPAGLFLLGTAFGNSATQGKWPYRRVGLRDVWVDDASAPSYNTWQILPSKAPATANAIPWKSFERLSNYERAIVIRHNDAPIIAGAGSAHFLHSSDLRRPTSGCTSLANDDLGKVLSWLDETSQPAMLQLAAVILP